MTPYKIKHKPTGFYYKPGIENNLSFRGKIYQTNNSEYHRCEDFISVYLKTDGKVYKSFPHTEYEYKETHRLDQIIMYIPKEEFEIEYIK